MAQPELTGELFYEKLFELDPALKGMFPEHLDEQIHKLINMITYMVSRLQTLPQIQKDIDAMAIRHTGYGVKDEHYTLVGEALLWVLEKRLEDQWDEETGHAWSEIYRIWADSMIRASHQAPD